MPCGRSHLASVEEDTCLLTPFQDGVHLRSVRRKTTFTATSSYVTYITRLRKLRCRTPTAASSWNTRSEQATDKARIAAAAHAPAHQVPFDPHHAHHSGPLKTMATRHCPFASTRALPLSRNKIIQGFGTSRRILTSFPGPRQDICRPRPTHGEWAPPSLSCSCRSDERSFHPSIR